jgi:adenine-specific DNA-methyltransferase
MINELVERIVDDPPAAWEAWCRQQPAGDEPSPRAFGSATVLTQLSYRALVDRDSALADFPWQHQALFDWWQPMTADDLDPEAIGLLSQHALPLAYRQALGQVYTPATLVTLMLDRVGYCGAVILEQRLLDPACGAGAFLLSALERLIDASQAEGCDRRDCWRQAQRGLIGFDRDPIAIALAELAIVARLAKRCPLDTYASQSPLQLAVTDALSLDDPDARTAALKRRQSFEGEGFDYVIANPPYGKLPSARLSDEQRQRFGATMYGHPNLYGLFFQAGVEWLNDQGQLAFLTPTSMVSGKYFSKLRQFLIASLDLTGFDVFSDRSGIFTDVLQQVMISYGVRRSGQSPTVVIREFSATNIPSHELHPPASAVLLDQRFDSAFFVSADPLAHQLLARLLGGRPLSELGYQISTGTIVWNRLEALLSDTLSDDVAPLCWSQGIRPFAFRGLGNRAGRHQGITVTPRSAPLMVSGDALLVKRLTAREEPRRLVACRLPVDLRPRWCAENHVNVIRQIEPSDVPLDALLGLLNSRLFEYVFRALNGNTQVSATELRQLPIIRHQSFERLVAISQALQADPTRSRDTLDDCVDQLYQLTSAESTALRRALP